MRILGIDPGLATVGLGVIDTENGRDLQIVEWLTIQTAAGQDLAVRLAEIHTDLSAFIDDIKPDLIVVEKLFFETNVRTAIDVAQARGVILMTAAEFGCDLLEITPLQLKSGITGDGSADKTQVQSMLVQMLHLTEIPKPDDAADALALAVYGALHHRTAVSL